MWPATPDGLVRPLLAVGKAALLAWLEEQGLPYRRDPSNLSRAYRRNRIRLDLLPELQRLYNPRLKEAVWRAQTLLQEEERLLAAETDRLLARVCRAPAPDFYRPGPGPAPGPGPRLAVAPAPGGAGPPRCGADALPPPKPPRSWTWPGGKRAAASSPWGPPGWPGPARSCTFSGGCRPPPPAAAALPAALPGAGETPPGWIWTWNTRARAAGGSHPPGTPGGRDGPGAARLSPGGPLLSRPGTASGPWGRPGPKNSRTSWWTPKSPAGCGPIFPWW